MKKEKIVRAHTRKTKSGKVTQVKQHTAKYDAASMAKEALKKVGSGEELKTHKKLSEIPVSLDDFKVWYHWDGENDPENEIALKVENALIEAMGKKAYNKFYNEATDNWTAKGHKKSYESIAEKIPEKKVKKQPAPELPEQEPLTTGSLVKGKDGNEYIITNIKKKTLRKISDVDKYFQTIKNPDIKLKTKTQKQRDKMVREMLPDLNGLKESSVNSYIRRVNAGIDTLNAMGWGKGMPIKITFRGMDSAPLLHWEGGIVKPAWYD